MQPPSSTERGLLAGSQDLAERLEFARHIGNYRVDARRLRQALYRTARGFYEARGASASELAALGPLPAPPPAWQGLPTIGSAKVFALLIEFSDELHVNNAADINDALFGNPATGEPYESLTEYYRRSSYEQLNLTGTTLGWYKTGKKRSEIPTTDAGRDALIKEAIQYFDAQGHDFSQYDNNHDGVIDYFMVFWTGKDTGWATFWWGYQTEFSNPGFTVDGVRLGKYSWQWEANGSAFNPRVVIHETGHALGLPDLYDYDGKVGPDGGVGGADMMDGTWLDHNCFSKWMLEWLEPTVITSGCQNVTLAPTAEAPECVAVWPSLEQHEMFSELFMVQNRGPVGNDLQLPGSGLLIWHIDASLDPSGQDFLYNNSYTKHKYVRLMEADGAEDIESNGGFDVGDFYSPGETLDSNTTPSSATYDGAPSPVSVSKITSSGANLSAYICASPASPKIDVPTKVNFGWVKVGVTRTKKVKISNTGTAPLHCTISMSPSPDFQLITGPLMHGGCGSSTPAIAPGASCSFSVSFKPHLILTAAHAVIDIASDDPDKPLVQVLVWGAGGII